MFFPEEAYDIKQGKDTFDNAVFTYKLDVEESGFNIMLLLGVALMLVGGIGFVLQKRQIKKSRSLLLHKHFRNNGGLQQ